MLLSSTSELPVYCSSRRQPGHFPPWRFYCSAALFGAIVYVVLFQFAYGFTRQPPSALQMDLLTEPSATPPPPHKPPHVKPPSPSTPTPPTVQHNVSDPHYQAPFRLFNYHRLELEELQTVVRKTDGFFARDWSLWLGWNNMRYIIDSAFLNARLLNRTLVLPSYVYARACEYELDVCADYAEMVNRGAAMHTDQWSELPPEQQMGWRVPLGAMLNITRMREMHPVILVSDYLRMHGLPEGLERSDGAWDRELYHANATSAPSLFVVETEWYDDHWAVRVDSLPEDMRARGRWTTDVRVGERGTRSHWPAEDESLTSQRLRETILSEFKGVARYESVVPVLKDTEAALAHDLDTDAGVEAALHDAGWEVLYSFGDVSNSDMAKSVVSYIREAAPRSVIRPWADEYRAVDANVLLLAGEVHNGRKPGTIAFTTLATREDYQRAVLHRTVPIDAVQSLAERLAQRMTDRVEGRLWMGGHMRRGDFVTFGWGPGGHRNPDEHIALVKSQLARGRLALQDVHEVEPYSVPDVQPNLQVVTRERPKDGDAFYLATDERDPATLNRFREHGAVLLDDLLTTEDRRALGWPLLLTDIRAVVEQELLAHAAVFSGSALSSVAGGVVNMRAAHGADRRTAVVE